MYSVDEMNKKIDSVLSMVSGENVDIGKVSTELTDIRENYLEENNARIKAESDYEKIKADNESLVAANSALFLKTGAILKNGGENPLEKAPEMQKKEPFDFNSLFDENGELK